MSVAGIDSQIFKAHSVRGASTTYMFLLCGTMAVLLLLVAALKTTICCLVYFERSL